MFHYTYLIQHKTEDKRYIGVRSSTCQPIEDTAYWGSSRYLPSDVKTTHSKIILAVHSSREDAIAHEILLHELNDVAINPAYYNKAKQTSTKFDTTGTVLSAEHKAKCSATLKGRTFSEETKLKISKALTGRKFSESHREACIRAQRAIVDSPGYISPSKGLKRSEETKIKISKIKQESGENKGINNNRFKPWFVTVNDITYLYYDITKEEQSLKEGKPRAYYQRLSQQSLGWYPMTDGAAKGAIVGNIEEAQKSYKANLPKTKPLTLPWFITHQTYSEVFYYTTQTAYAKANSIKEQAIRDAVNLSKGIKPMRRGHFAGLILGTLKQFYNRPIMSINY